MLKTCCFALACLAAAACSLDLLGTYEGPTPTSDLPYAEDARPPPSADASAPVDAGSAQLDVGAPATDAWPPPDSVASCPSGVPTETEPNDIRPNPIDGAICGVIGLGDVDRFVFNADHEYEIDFLGDLTTSYEVWSGNGPRLQMLTRENGSAKFGGDPSPDPIQVKVSSYALTRSVYIIKIAKK
jgi:hypothetical protein